MIAATSKPSSSAHAVDSTCGTRSDRELLERLDEAFEQRFVVLDAERGVLERVSRDWPRADAFRWLSVCEQVSRRGRAEILEDYSPLLLLAAPLETLPGEGDRLAVTVLLTDRVETPADLAPAARVFGVDPQEIYQWARNRMVWSPRAARKLAESLVEACRLRSALGQQKAQLSDVSANLLATFDELDLLHRLTERLSLDRSTQRLAAETLRWLGDVVPADCVIAHWREETIRGDRSAVAEAPDRTLVVGESPIDIEEFDRFFFRLGPNAERRSLVLNRDRTDSPTWCYPSVREVVAAPIGSHDRPVGWIAALNSRPGTNGEAGVFGSVESSLLSSVAAILGVHNGNRRLFHEQRALFDGAVRAFSSALDAKDPYTRGHSDRVSQIAVRLAEHLGVEDGDLRILRLGGLLHDIGKIGVDDKVLRKTGRLSEEEYEHVKRHPVMGEEILRGVPQLSAILPVVRHHHECWDGSGYPDGLEGEETPSLARIAAVADAIDAMGSDRPYRRGMPAERVESILREGAGSQWDPAVVDAYFAVRADVMAIVTSKNSAAASES